jgi:hypothetical protein
MRIELVLLCDAQYIVAPVPWIIVKLKRSVTVNALARRYQRGDNRSDNAVLADLLELACAFPEQALAGGDFRVATRDGAFVGELVRYNGQPFLTARTYVAG